MDQKVACLSICILALAASCLDDPRTPGATGQTGRNEAATVAEIEAVLDLYEKSVNQADFTLLREIWAPGDQVSYLNPLQRLRLSRELEGFWQNFLQKGFSQRELKRKNVSIHTAGQAAWAVFDWEFKATTTDGRRHETSGWETQIYRLTDRGWRIAHVHYSVPVAPPQSPEQ